MPLRLGVLLLTGILATMDSTAELQVTDLRCEYKTNPLGIDVTAPRLTWTLKADVHAQVQSAYQILVSSTPELLDADGGDRWDSGKVASEDTTFIRYDGAALASRDRCYWKVRVWNGANQPSAWSAPAFWSMGLLTPGDWSAQWIGYDAPVETAVNPDDAPVQDMGNAQWIWYPEGNPGESAPVGDVFFRAAIEVGGSRARTGADLYITADNSARAWLNGVELEGTVTSFNQVSRINLNAPLRPGKNTLAVLANNAGDAPNPAGMIARVVVDYVEGPSSFVETGDTWKSVRGEAPAGWNAPGFDDTAWQAALAIGPAGTPPWPVPKFPKPLFLPPPPQLRAAFMAGEGITRATLYATAFGLYEATLNGQRAGDFVFAPGFTDYNKRVYYQTYDVTDLVKPGENVFGALLGDGWYAGYLGFLPQLPVESARDHYGDQPRFRGQLEIEYADGHSETIATDGAWKAAYGSIREADMLMGETHDDHLATPGWLQAGFNDRAWKSVAVGQPHDVPVQAHPGSPVTRHERIAARSVKEVEPGVFIYDLGQNFAGWLQFTVEGKAGQRIQVRHGERLDADGTLYTTNLRKARCIDTYTLDQDGRVTLEPHFTFHGFQYAEISGIDGPLPLEYVTGVAIQSAIEPAGQFECSEPLLNQLFHNIVWGQKSNYLEIPTDCPQRDERMGWTGDAQFFMPTALFNMDSGAFFTKWLVDLVQDSQLEDGSFADVAPHVALGGGSVAWGDAAMTCTYQLYRYYGDTGIIHAHFPNLVRGMEFLESTSENGIRKKMGYGDWLNKGGGAKDEVICTAYFAYLAGLMAEMAEVIGETDKAAHYTALQQEVKDAFATNFIDADGKILDSSQTGYALAFTMDLIPDALRDRAAEQFAGEIARFDNHLATGFIGTPRLLPGLAAAGKIDLAYQLLMNTDYPSWLFQVTQGATTMWERWDGWTPEDGFQDPGMNSFNHYAFGAVGEWLYSTIGGIAPLEPGFKTFQIAPQPGGGLTWAKTSYDSIHGLIRSDWSLAGGDFTLKVEAPVNTTVTVVLPPDYRGEAAVNGEQVTGDAGALKLPSGMYTITSQES